MRANEAAPRRREDEARVREGAGEATFPKSVSGVVERFHSMLSAVVQLLLPTLNSANGPGSVALVTFVFVRVLLFSDFCRVQLQRILVSLYCFFFL